MRYGRIQRELIGAIIVLAMALVMPRAADAAATITVVNLDGSLEGFNDPSTPDAASAAGGNTGATLGQQRLIAFQRAADIWGRFVDSNVTIRVGANFDPLSCSASSTILGYQVPGRGKSGKSRPA